jgi:hypothetical protein
MPVETPETRKSNGRIEVDQKGDGTDTDLTFIVRTARVTYDIGDDPVFNMQ